MRTARILRWVFVGLLGMPLGCSSKPVTGTKTDTGAEQVAKSFFEALTHDDWPTAYSSLDATSKKWCSKEQFAQLGKAYRDSMHFAPESVAVSVTETDSQASAVVVFRSASGGEQHSFRDGTTLKHGPDGWAIVLRSNFGRKSPLTPAPNSPKTGPR